MVDTVAIARDRRLMRVGTSSGWAAFQSGDFRHYCGSRFLSGAARQMQNVTVGMFVYELTHSAWALGIAGLFAFLPALLFVFFTGHVADSFNRRVVVMLSHLVGAVAAAGLLVCALIGVEAIWPVYALIAVGGTSRAFGNPATKAMLPAIVPREQFGSAVAWNSSVWQTATLTGPAIGGLLYAWSPTLAFAGAALFYVVAAGMIGAIRSKLGKPERAPVSWAALSAGLRFIGSHRVILGSLTLDLVAVLLGGVTALLPIFAQDILHIGPLGLGLMRSTQALGALCTASLLAHWPISRRSGPRMLQAVGVYGLAIIGFGLSTDVILSFACLFVVGAADMVSVFVRQTIIPLETPDAMRGRVSAVDSFFSGASNSLGEFESGALAAMIGAVPTVVIGGVASIVLAFTWSRLFPELRQRDRLIPEPVERAAAP
jgi:MFS family permease